MDELQKPLVDAERCPAELAPFARPSALFARVRLFSPDLNVARARTLAYFQEVEQECLIDLLVGPAKNRLFGKHTWS